MAYIRKEEVAEKRAKLKEAFPAKDGWKLSVTRQHSSTISVVVMEAPYQMLEQPEQGNETVNYYYIKEHFGNTRKANDLSKIYDIINAGNFDDSDPMSDYFHVGFYVNLDIGKWDKAFKVSTK